MVKHEGKYEGNDQPKFNPPFVVKAFLVFWVLVALASLIASVS